MISAEDLSRRSRRNVQNAFLLQSCEFLARHCTVGWRARVSVTVAVCSDVVHPTTETAPFEPTAASSMHHNKSSNNPRRPAVYSLYDQYKRVGPSWTQDFSVGGGVAITAIARSFYTLELRFGCQNIATY